MRGFLCILAVLCLSAAVMALDLYEYAPRGMGTGIFSCEKDGVQIVHREYRRCGPEALSFASQLIECHGVFATCAEWATMQMRMDGIEGYSLRIDNGTVNVSRFGVDVIAAVGLSNFCRAQSQ